MWIDSIKITPSIHYISTNIYRGTEWKLLGLVDNWLVKLVTQTYKGVILLVYVYIYSILFHYESIIWWYMCLMTYTLYNTGYPNYTFTY